MRTINNYINEKLSLNADIDVPNHNAEYFPFDLIKKKYTPGQWECYSIKVNGNTYWKYISTMEFRRTLMSIFQKTKYKDILMTYTDNTNYTYCLLGGRINKSGYVKWILHPTGMSIDKCIWKEGYTIIQKKMSNSRYLTSSLNPYISSGTEHDFKHIYMSWLDNYECIAINFNENE